MNLVSGLVIAGTHSGVGKTTITMGLLAALCRRGMVVQSYKAGPDYIDPAFHRLITGRPCSNLDTWLMDQETVRRLYRRAGCGAGFGVVEGVMGLFDTKPGFGPGGPGSTADLALKLGLPVVLVVDARAAAQSVAAMVHGFATLDPALRIAGVIVNRTGSGLHARMVKQAVEKSCRLPVFGCLPADVVASLPERHLGLVGPEAEHSRWQAYFQLLAEVCEACVDLDQVLAAGRPAGNLPVIGAVLPAGQGQKKVRVAIARDQAFSFYYTDALRDLTERGVEWVPFSPVAGEGLPAGITGVYLGGGYPELYLEQLAGNGRFLADLRHAERHRIPIFAEGGGYMVLCRTMQRETGPEYTLAGLVPAWCRMTDRLQGLGYLTMRVAGDTLLGSPGDLLRGHKFHYSKVTFPAATRSQEAFLLAGEDCAEGYSHYRLTASYVHMHFSAFPAVMDHLIAQCGCG